MLSKRPVDCWLKANRICDADRGQEERRAFTFSTNSLAPSSPMNRTISQYGREPRAFLFRCGTKCDVCPQTMQCLGAPILCSVLGLIAIFSLQRHFGQ